MQVAIDIDGPLVTCRAVGEGIAHQFVALTGAFRISGPLPSGRVTYGLGQEHYGVREPDGFGGLLLDTSAAASRVRIQDALLRALQSVPGVEVNVTLASSLQEALVQGGEDPAAALHESAVVRRPTPASVRIRSARSYPRTLAAFLDWMNDDAGCLRTDRAGSTTAVYVDVGPTQTTIARLSLDDDSVDPGATRTLERGWVDLAKALEVGLRENHAMGAVRPEVVANILLAGRYRLRGRHQRADALIAEAAAPLAADIKAQVDALGGADPVIVVGMPALHVAALLADTLERAVLTPDDPAFANVRGLLKYAAAVPVEGGTP